jgi:site-specific DNA-methyltransferase (adenine-specific)
MRYMVETYTLPGDVVLDPFCGSGSTLVACKQTGRQWIGIEKTHEYAETSKSRLAQELAFF